MARKYPDKLTTKMSPLHRSLHKSVEVTVYYLSSNLFIEDMETTVS